jgi:hypothetical protein
MASKTEILDLAPIDLLNGMSRDFVAALPTEMAPDEIKAKALDFEFHWVNETGKTANLTGGLNIEPTVLNNPVGDNQTVRLIVNQNIG